MRYEDKFPRLIALCEDAKSRGAEFIVISHPEVLGDTYTEPVESLNRISDSGLKLFMVPRSERAERPNSSADPS